MVLLNETIMPNLVQTSEHTPALIHTGSFGNIAHGTSSVIAQRMALQLADYVVNEAGFGADLGVEKFLRRNAGPAIKPSAAILVATVRGIRHQSQGEATNAQRRLREFGQAHRELAQVSSAHGGCSQSFPDDGDGDIRAILDFCARSASHPPWQTSLTKEGRADSTLRRKRSKRLTAPIWTASSRSMLRSSPSKTKSRSSPRRSTARVQSISAPRQNKD